MAGIYLHIPFCRQACTYCDFYFETSRKHRSAFTGRLLEEIRLKVALSPELSADPIHTIYFGGGTPSQLSPDEIAEIMQQLRELFSIRQDSEISFEINPDDLTPDRIDTLIEAGVNRFSIGVQTFNDDRLAFMNRAHRSAEAKKGLELLAGAGLKSWTADLIYGNPGQSLKDVKQDVQTLLEYGPPHISAYTLTVEPRTRLGSLVRKNLVKPAEDHQVARQMELVTQLLDDAGLKRYEASNFARAGHESRHNGAYWKHINYTGFGPAAHSFRWSGDRQQASRWSGAPNLHKYIYGDESDAQSGIQNRFEEEILDLTTLAQERLLLGLRTRDGVDENELLSRYGYVFSEKQISWMSRMEQEGLMRSETIDSGARRFALTQKGWQMADYITLNIIERE
ncbi:MAG: radical SAM family heme chaperone HemW [Balneolales bacterium]|nr:radical SAM family heme chaperone HemW [Balneolales bacterium]